MSKPTLYGASYSVYVRIIMLCLREKGIAFDHREIDIFNPEQTPSDYLQHHPFGKIPAFEHEGFKLYETSAITRYIDEAFTGSAPLFPSSIQERARINQIISILDNYAYPVLVWDIYVEACEADSPDEEKISAAIPKAKTCLQALESLCGENTYLVGQELSLADIYACPIFSYFLESPQGKDLLPDYPKLEKWWNAVKVYGDKLQ
ncbi:MAG: glutathione S-transferase family protein [Rhodospirillales bacterium]|jgi:glutathione S-transferase|nr:glutathione S-transferase family protein [Rhodospirillales bacterium]